jgi:hypothetical protein
MKKLGIALALIVATVGGTTRYVAHILVGYYIRCRHLRQTISGY